MFHYLFEKPSLPDIKIQRIHPDAKMPGYMTKGAAGADLSASEFMLIPGGATAPVKTGVIVELPDGFEAQIRSRSGMASKGHVVANSPGTIDCDYRGEIIVLIHNTTYFPLRVNVGDRIAQMVIKPAPQFTFVEGEITTKTERGANGCGSTGKA